MNDEQKREHAEAIKHALGMGYGPPMEGEEGWVPVGPEEALREAKERRMAKELAEKQAKAAEPAPSTDPWAVIGKAEDDGDRIMDITRNFG